MKKYRKLYEEYYGPIIKDEDGRSYEIHHIDGNRNNNSIDNLQCVSIKEHYNIHYNQKDWGACNKILLRMKTSPEELSKLCSETSSKSNQKRIQNRTHNWLKENGGSEKARNIQKNRVKNGTHIFLIKNYQTDNNKKRVVEGTHHFLGGIIQKNLINKRLNKGTHPSQIKKLCPYCNRNISITVFGRFHGDKCKKKALK